MDILSNTQSLISQCYKRSFAGRTIKGIKFGTNVISLNYTFIQVMLQYDFFYPFLKKCIYLTTDPKLLKKYNEEWKLIVPVLNQRHKLFAPVDKQGNILREIMYEWNYRELLLEDYYTEEHFD
jgi:hypothetical protein